MAAIYTPTTPTQSGSPASINTPTTPRFGAFADKWDPYTPAPPRKSARLSSRANHNRTPSPNSSTRTPRPSHLRKSPNTSAPSQEKPSHQLADMSSPPATSPQKKRQPPSASRSVSGSLTAESIRNAARALGQSHSMDASSSSSRAALALPTPAKTPTHKHSEQKQKDVNAVARTLFSKPQQPNIKKVRSKRTNEISADNFEIHDDEAPIQIFTDSENRLPETDASAENPFYGDAGIAASAVPVRRSSRNKQRAIAEKQQTEQNLQRDDGILYVFRGKKVFRKFTEADSPSRRAVQPRLLFPSTKATKDNELLADEEAETDIDESARSTNAATTPAVQHAVESPVEPVEEKIDTPKAPKFAPASPPATSRATRSKKIIADEPTPIKLKGKRTPSGSLFDSWRRTKSGSSSSSAAKRPGEPLAKDAAAKRPKA